MLTHIYHTFLQDTKETRLMDDTFTLEEVPHPNIKAIHLQKDMNIMIHANGYEIMIHANRYEYHDF